MVLPSAVSAATGESERCEERHRASFLGIPVNGLVLAGIWFVFVMVEFSNAGIDLLAYLTAVFGSLLWG